MPNLSYREYERHAAAQGISVQELLARLGAIQEPLLRETNAKLDAELDQAAFMKVHGLKSIYDKVYAPQKRDT